jgi:hypothetical protein
VLLGPHVSFAGDKLVLELLVGPTFTVYASNGLSGNDLDNNVQMNAGTSVGVDSVLGLHYFTSRAFAIGVELGYRSLVTGPVHASDATGNYSLGTVSPIDLDLSGFRGVIDIALLAM